VVSLKDSREQEARKLVDSKAVKRYVIVVGNGKQNRERFVVVGQAGEYVVEDDACSCQDFRRHLESTREESGSHKTPLCKHCLALRLAREESGWETYYLSLEEYRSLRPYFWKRKT